MASQSQEPIRFSSVYPFEMPGEQGRVRERGHSGQRSGFTHKPALAVASLPTTGYLASP